MSGSANLEIRRCPRDQGLRPRSEHAADGRHESRGGDHGRERRREKLWAGTVTIDPDAKTGAHHHGPVESVIYVVAGRARMRWGERLEFTAEAGPGDFTYPALPPASGDQCLDRRALELRAGASGQEPIVVNLDIEAAEAPETVRWVDDLHH